MSHLYVWWPQIPFMHFSHGAFFNISTCPFEQRSVFDMWGQYLTAFVKYLTISANIRYCDLSIFVPTIFITCFPFSIPFVYCVVPVTDNSWHICSRNKLEIKALLKLTTHDWLCSNKSVGIQSRTANRPTSNKHIKEQWGISSSLHV